MLSALVVVAFGTWWLKGSVSGGEISALREQARAHEAWRKVAEEQAKIAGGKVEKAEQQVASLEARLRAADGDWLKIVEAIKTVQLYVREAGQANIAVRASLSSSPDIVYYGGGEAKEK